MDDRWPGAGGASEEPVWGWEVGRELVGVMGGLKTGLW